MKFFSLNSPVYVFMQRLWDVFRINLLWLLCSLPIITLGCSTIAAYSVTLRMAEDSEGHIVSDFFKAFKANLKQGIPMSFITIICFMAVSLDFQIYNALEENSLPFLIIGVFAAYIFTMSLLYVYPLLARYENTIFKSLKNSYRLSMRYFGRTILLIFIVALEIVIIIWNTTTMFIGLLIGPACIMYTISGVAMHIFRDIEKEPDSTRKSSTEE